MLKDKRKMKRRHLILYLRIFNELNNELLGFVVDITTQGLMIMSEHPIEVGKFYHLKMLVESWDNRHTYLSFEAKSRWCQRSVNTDFYDTGLELIDISSSNFKGIKKIITDLGFSDKD